MAVFSSMDESLKAFKAFQESAKAERLAAMEAMGLEQSGTLETWKPGEEAYIFVQAGGARFLKLASVSGDWWARTGSGLDRASWCCCPGTATYKPVRKG